MAINEKLNPKLIVQPLSPGMTVPQDFDGRGLFLLNFAEVLRDDVWDDYGNKELDQENRLRNLASHINAMADAIGQLGLELKAYPEQDDYEVADYEQTWEKVREEMESTFDGGYSDLENLVEKFRDAAVGDFMD